MTDPGAVRRGIGLALSGGAARGIAHIGVLEVLREEGIPVSAVAGTSAGSIVGALYAGGMSPADIGRIALETKWRDLVRPAVPKGGLLSGEGLRAFLLEVLPVKRFEALPVPFVAVATDLRSGRKVNLSRGSVAKAVQASCSLPLVFAPLRMGGMVLVDGGVASMLPVRTVREELGAAKVAAVNVNARRGADGDLDSVFQIATQLTHLYATRNAEEEGRLADVLISVDTTDIPLYDLSAGERLLRLGREAARRGLPGLRALLGKETPGE